MYQYTEFFCKLPHRARVLLEVSAYEDSIRLVLVEHALRGGAFEDSSDSRHDEIVAQRGFDWSGQVSLECFRTMGWQCLNWGISGGGDVEHVDAVLGEEFCKLDAFSYKRLSIALNLCWRT